MRQLLDLLDRQLPLIDNRPCWPQSQARRWMLSHQLDICHQVVERFGPG